MLESLQSIVGGYIECIYPFTDKIALIYNEEEKLNGLSLNRALIDKSGEINDIIAGSFIIAGISNVSDNFSSLSEELVKKYTEFFYETHSFFKEGNEIKIIKG